MRPNSPRPKDVMNHLTGFYFYYLSTADELCFIMLMCWFNTKKSNILLFFLFLFDFYFDFLLSRCTKVSNTHALTLPLCYFTFLVTFLSLYYGSLKIVLFSTVTLSIKGLFPKLDSLFCWSFTDNDSWTQQKNVIYRFISELRILPCCEGLALLVAQFWAKSQ